MKILIKITKDVILEARFLGHQDLKVGNIDFDPNYTNKCPIALAIRDIVPDAIVGHSNLIINDEFIELPADVKRFIKRFDTLSPDERIELEPIFFEIDIPEEIINTIGIDEIIPIIKNSKTLELV